MAVIFKKSWGVQTVFMMERIDIRYALTEVARDKRQDTNRNHTASFRRKSKMNKTELSKHIWTLNDNNKRFTIKWRVCKPYNSISNKCNLCLFEKYVIICKRNLCSLNKRNELASSCPHRTRYLLKNFFVK